MIIDREQFAPSHPGVQSVEWYEQDEDAPGFALFVHVRSRHVSTSITVTARTGEFASVNWPGSSGFGSAPLDFATSLGYAAAIADHWNKGLDEPHDENTMAHFRNNGGVI